MAHLKSFYLPSTAEGLSWSISYHKPQGRPGVISASEGELDSSPGFTIFRTILFQSRSFRQEVDGRATKKNIAATVVTLINEMRDREVINSAIADTMIKKASVGS
jgi:hypothetical protein